MSTQTLTSRQIWMSALAKAPLELLEQRMALLGSLPAYDFLRVPEIGLAMVQARAGGTGDPFYVGEMTLVRCVVRLQLGDEAIAGYGYVGGRSLRHAELAAVCDALLQHQEWGDRVYTTVIQPLLQAAQQKREQEARHVEATRVNFFTMVRGQG